MNCIVAQRLLEHNVPPGSSTPVRAELGFHIASCSACRRYYNKSQAALLDTLLAAPVAAIPITNAPVAAQTVARQRNRWRWPLVTGSLIATLLLLFVVIPSASAIIRTVQNVQSYQLPTAAVSPTPAGLAPVAAVVVRPTARPTLAARVAVATTAPASLPQTTVPPAPPTATARTLPTQTITPVPLDAILAITRAAAPIAAVPGRAAAPVPASSEAITMLLMGVDRRPSESGGTRSDTIMIARLDPQRQRIAMLSLPRDLIVPIPGVGYARINAANAYGESAGPGGGIALARQTVSGLLGLPIDYVVQIDFEGFIGAIDAIGGIDIDVPTELYDPEFPTMDYGYTVAHFLVGPQHMDGARALMYARVRHADSDFFRMRRQQSVMVAALARVRNQNVVQQLHAVADVTGALRGFIQTDLPQEQMISLAWSFRNVAPAQVERYTLDENAVQTNVLPDDPYAQFALPGTIEQLSQQLINGPEQ